MMTKNLREFAVQGSALQYLLENTQGGPDGNISTSYTNMPSNYFKTAFQFTHQRESQHKPDNEKVFVKAAPARIYPPKSSHRG